MSSQAGLPSLDPRWTEITLLKLHLGATDRIGGEGAAEWLIQAARRLGLRGATVTQGVMGFGPDGALHRASLFHLAQNLPVVVELADRPAAIARFLAEVGAQLPASALVTTQAARTPEWRTPEWPPDGPPERAGEH